MLDKVRNLQLGGHVGFDSLPDQLVNKSVQKGFVFNILCIGEPEIGNLLQNQVKSSGNGMIIFYQYYLFALLGETGIGKSTLMDSLFNTNFDSNPSPHTLSAVKLKSHTYELQESNVQMKVH